MFKDTWKFIGLAIILLVIVVSCSSCSLLPKISFGGNNSVPQQTETKSKVVKCAGTWAISDDQSTMACSSGFYSNESNYSQKERKMGFFERIGSFISNLKGIFGGLILVTIVMFFCGLGGVAVSIWQTLFGIGTRTIKATVLAIKNAKEKLKVDPTNGQIFLDELAKIHSSDPEIQAYVNKIRAEIASK
jgi:hypothetical protein